MTSASTKAQTNPPARCRAPKCAAVLPENADFCPRCGLMTSYLTYDFFEDAAGTIPVRAVSDGRSFYLVVSNHGPQDIPLEILHAEAKGLCFVNLPNNPRVRGGSSAAYEVQKLAGERVRGMLEIRSRSAGRGERWWERWDWETKPIYKLMSLLPSVWNG